MSKYFAISAIAVGVAFALWSVPFAFETSASLLRSAVFAGDISIYAFFATCAYLVWYLLDKPLSINYFIIPTITVCLVGVYGSFMANFSQEIGVKDGLAILPVNNLTNGTQAILSVWVFLAGAMLIRSARQQTTVKKKLSITTAGLLYVLGSVAGILNTTVYDGPKHCGNCRWLLLYRYHVLCYCIYSS